MSCSKKKEDSSIPDCKLLKTIGLYSGFGNQDTANYTFDNNNNLSRVTISNGLEYTATYSDRKLLTIELRIQGNPAGLVGISFFYNTDETIQKIIRSSIFGADTSYVITSQFYYSNNQIEKVYYTEYDKPSNSLVNSEDYYFTWENGNIIKLKSVNTFHTPDSSVWRYNYDNKPNYFQKIHGNVKYPFVNPHFGSGISPNSFPNLLSKNNYIGSPDNPLYIISYIENNNGLLEAMYWDGDLNERYFYSCQ